jgi:predicted membrane-bound spermidine synthase
LKSPKRAGKKQPSGQKTKHSDHVEAAVNKLIGRAIIYLIVFFAGSILMIIEIAANRVLAPIFGNSLYTWTSLIGVILLSMSVGYYLGGWLVDKRPTFLLLVHTLVLASIATLLVPIIKPLMGHVLKGDAVGVVWGPVFGTFFVFALPALLLGSIPPVAIRLSSLISSDKHVGLSAGQIGMISTLGSVIGTFAAGFFLIPRISLPVLFIIMGIVVGLLALIGGLLFYEKLVNRLLSTALISSISLLLVFLNTCLWRPFPKDILFQKTTYYNEVTVRRYRLADGNILRALYLDTTLEGAQYVKSRHLPIEYQRYWQLGCVFLKDIHRAAFLGAGAYGMPQRLIDMYPKAEVEVVEIDPVVIHVGRLFFNTSNYPRLHSVCSDARRYLSTTRKSYDFIFGDAFNGIRNVPSHLLSQEFFDIVKTRLTPNGIFLMNIISAITGPKSLLFKSVVKTLKTVFPFVSVYAVSSFDLASIQNIIIVASTNKMVWSWQNVRDKRLKIGLGKMWNTFVSENRYTLKNGIIITDNYNPAEYIIARSLLN